MITIKTKQEMEKMVVVGNKLGAIFDKIAPEIRPGRTTYEIDKLITRYIKESGGVPNFSLEDGYHHAICASVNEVVIHGVPSKSVVLKEGDILSIDMGNLDENGYNGDACRTFPVGNISDEAKKLIRCTEECFYEALKVCYPGRRLFEISQALQRTADKYGYTLLKEYGGHGIGRSMHEDPFIPNYYSPSMGLGPILREGMCIAIEPMVMSGKPEIETLDDGWGVVSVDRKINCHYENDVIIQENGPLITSIDSNVKRHLQDMEVTQA